MNPYTDENNTGYKIRTFEKDVPEEELIWHTDERTRVVEVLESKGWQFQFDDELPFGLQRGTIINIPKGKIHRIIKGNSNLVIKIKEI
tara:strand:+ start:3122 stop:3385 length:264 start_codon:yes stop_codon:yes gene_type:complete